MLKMCPLKSRLRRVLVLAICLALATHSTLASGDTSATNSDMGETKDSDMLSLHKRPSFFVGSRYGRSSAVGSMGGGNIAYAPSKTRRLSVVPRNDRFFLGSRYGKRTNEFMSPYEQGAIAELNDANNNKNFKSVRNSASATLPPYSMMSCIYTGHRNYYRCNSVEEINSILNQLTAAQQEVAAVDGVAAASIEDNSMRK